MAWRDRIAIVVFGVGALLSVAWAYRGVRDALMSLDAGGGAFGSSNDFALLGYVVPVFITFWLSARLRNRGRTEHILCRVHLLAMMTFIVIFALFVGLALGRLDVVGHGRFAWALFASAFIAGALWLPVQTFFAAGFLGLLIKGRRVATLAVFLIVLTFLGARAGAGPPRPGSGSIFVNGVSLHYEMQGKGPVLVFLHAGIADSRMWDEQVRHFRARFTVVRFDQRGYGASAPATHPFAPVEDCEALLNALGIDHATVIGSSFGGTVALDLAAAHPGRVSRLVMVSASPGWMSFSKPFTQRTVAIAEAGQQYGAGALVDGWMHDPMLAIASERGPMAKVMRGFLTRNAAGILSTPMQRPPDIPTPTLADVRIPTLIIVGDHDDPEIVARAHEMAVAIPGAQAVVVAGADHMVNLERPGEFDRALERFLRQ